MVSGDVAWTEYSPVRASRLLRLPWHLESGGVGGGDGSPARRLGARG